MQKHTRGGDLGLQTVPRRALHHLPASPLQAAQRLCVELYLMCDVLPVRYLYIWLTSDKKNQWYGKAVYEKVTNQY